MEAAVRKIEKRKRDQLRLIKKFALSIAKKNTIEEVVWDVVENVISKLEFEDCTIYLLDEKSKTLIQKAAYGSKRPKSVLIKSPIRIPLEKGIVGQVAISGKPIVVNDFSEYKDKILKGEEKVSEIAVPIILNNKVFGVIDSENKQKSFFTSDHLYILETIASIMASKIILLKAYNTLKIRSRKLSVINSQYRQSAFVISHDFKSPLANIQGLIEIYKSNVELNKTSENDKIIELIESSVDKLVVRLDDINKVIKASAVPHKSARNINLSDSLAKVKMDIGLQIRNSNAKILEDFSEVNTIKYPRSYIESILLNLLTNAIKYRSEDRKLVIRVKSQQVDDYMLLTVKDNGIGIDLKKHGKQLFQLFQRINHKVEGRGLGLNIVKTQVESLGGKIEVESEVNQGTTFKIYLKDLVVNEKS